MARYKKPLYVSSNDPRWDNPQKLAKKNCKTCLGKGMIWVWTGTRNSCDTSEPMLCGCLKKKGDMTAL